MDYKNPYFITIPDILEAVSDSAYYPRRYKEPDNKNDFTKKAPILLLGCSYAFGTYLTSDTNFQGQLRKLTNRWVYNFGIPGHDNATALMLLEEEQKHPILKRKPEYIIYVYVFHHLQRNVEKKYYNFYRKEGFIPSQKYNFLYNFYTYAHFKNRILEDMYWNDLEFKGHQELFIKLLSKTKKITDKLYPQSKFIVLIYSDENYDHPDGTLENMGYSEFKLQKLFDIMESAEFKKKIENLGIEVITTQELIGRKMDKPEDRVPNDANRPHPTAKAWEEITPKFVERLKL